MTMFRFRLLFQHACLWAIPTMLYGLLAGGWAVARVDGTHLRDVLAGAAWAGGLMIVFGALVGCVSAVPVACVARRSPALCRWACRIQAMVLVLAGTWLYLNHQIMVKTDDALTAGALRFLFSNPKEVMDMAWRFAGYHLLAVCGGAVAMCVIVTRGMTRLNECLLQNAPPATDSRPQIVALLNRCHLRHPLGVAMIVLAILPAVLLAIQIHGNPSRYLVTTARVFAPLRAFQLTRWLTGPIVRVDPPPPCGAAIVTDDAYLRSQNVDRRRLRNVVFVLLESVPAKAIHCYGYPREVSPNIDRLAAEGVQLDRCYAASSFSSYSLVSTLTSLYMLRTAENDHFRQIDFPYVGIHDVLKSLGYELTCFSSGNEAWDNLETFTSPKRFDTYFSHNRSNVDKTDCNRMDDKYAMGEFARWIASRKGNRPFYCYINLQATHFNYEVPEPWNSRYKPVPPAYSNGDGVIHIPPEVVPLLKNQYDNALCYLDHWVGFIRTQLAERQLLDQSIIVVVGDHGEAFMEHGLARHGMHLWNEMIQVPAILHAPGLLAPRRVARATSQIDLVPTVIAAMGVTPHPAWQGVDVLAEGYDDLHRPVFSVLQLTRIQEAMIWGTTKYIADQDTRQEWLFDLATDPGETRNLADLSAPSELLLKARVMLAQWHAYQMAYYTGNRRLSHYVGMPKSW